MTILASPVRGALGGLAERPWMTPLGRAGPGNRSASGPDRTENSRVQKSSAASQILLVPVLLTSQHAQATALGNVDALPPHVLEPQSVVSAVQRWSLTTRADEQAWAADLGAWKTTLRLNREEDRKSRSNSVVGMTVGAIVASVSVMFIIRWHPQALWLWLVVLAMGVVGLGLLLVFARALLHKRLAGVRGMLLAHVYDLGVVFERTLGGVFAVPFDAAKIRYVCWGTGGDDDDGGDDERHREQLWVTLLDGSVRAVETWTEAERRQLSEFAGCLRLGQNPQVIDHVPVVGRPEVL